MSENGEFQKPGKEFKDALKNLHAQSSEGEIKNMVCEEQKREGIKGLIRRTFTKVIPR